MKGLIFFGLMFILQTNTSESKILRPQSRNSPGNILQQPQGQQREKQNNRDFDKKDREKNQRVSVGDKVKAMRDSRGERKITICHYPRGNSGEPVTITISERAWETHRAHGDEMGECSPSNLENSAEGTKVGMGIDDDLKKRREDAYTSTEELRDNLLETTEDLRLYRQKIQISQDKLDAQIRGETIETEELVHKQQLLKLALQEIIELERIMQRESAQLKKAETRLNGGLNSDTDSKRQ